MCSLFFVRKGEKRMNTIITFLLIILSAVAVYLVTNALLEARESSHTIQNEEKVIENSSWSILSEADILRNQASLIDSISETEYVFYQINDDEAIERLKLVADMREAADALDKKKAEDISRISDNITDMIMGEASSEELSKEIKHSMNVINA